ncbi:MAG: hypothetical protein R3F43_21795 [bacterium]
MTFRSGSPETAATTVRVEPSAGGALGDDFVAFSVTTDGPMALDDRLALDLDGVVVRVAAADLPLAQGTFLSVTGSLSNAINELDVGGRRSACVGPDAPYPAALTPGSRPWRRPRKRPSWACRAAWTPAPTSRSTWASACAWTGGLRGASTIRAACC